MKLFVVVTSALLLCATCITNATDLAKFKREGGQLVLTDDPAACPKGANRIVDLHDAQERRAGCYTLDPKTVHVLWSDGAAEKLDIKRFRSTREAQRLAEKERSDLDNQIMDKNLRDQPMQRDIPRPMPTRRGNSTPPPSGN